MKDHSKIKLALLLLVVSVVSFFTFSVDGSCLPQCSIIHDGPNARHAVYDYYYIDFLFVLAGTLISFLLLHKYSRGEKRIMRLATLVMLANIAIIPTAYYVGTYGIFVGILMFITIHILIILFQISTTEFQNRIRFAILQGFMIYCTAIGYRIDTICYYTTVSCDGETIGVGNFSMLAGVCGLWIISSLILPSRK